MTGFKTEKNSLESEMKDALKDGVSKGKEATSGIMTGFKNKENSLKGEVKGALKGGVSKGKTK